MNNFIESSNKSFLYFISLINSKLNSELKNSKFTKESLRDAIDIYYSIYNKENNINVIIYGKENSGLSFVLNIIQAYNIIFKNSVELIISDDTAKNRFFYMIEVFKLLELVYNRTIELKQDTKNKFLEILTFSNEKIKLSKDSSLFSINIIDDKNVDTILFDNWKITEGSKKINGIVEKYNNKNKKLIFTYPKQIVSDLLNSIDSSIIVNKINFK